MKKIILKSSSRSKVIREEESAQCMKEYSYNTNGKLRAVESVERKVFLSINSTLYEYDEKCRLIKFTYIYREIKDFPLYKLPDIKYTVTSVYNYLNDNSIEINTTIATPLKELYNVTDIINFDELGRISSITLKYPRKNINDHIIPLVDLKGNYIRKFNISYEYFYEYKKDNIVTIVIKYPNDHKSFNIIKYNRHNQKIYEKAYYDIDAYEKLRSMISYYYDKHHKLKKKKIIRDSEDISFTILRTDKYKNLR